MSGTRLQSYQLPDSLVSLPLCTGLQVLAQKDQGDNQGSGIIERRGPNEPWPESRHYAHQISCCRTKRDQGIHIRAGMAQIFDCAAMELPADDGPNGGRKREEEIVLTRKTVHEEHVEYNHRQRQHYAQDQ